MRGDHERIEQLFVNLLLNAAQAIPEGQAHENEIRVSVRALPGQGTAIVRIEDTGTGIPLEVQERIFQPFFTTKPIGQGTGLGLSICRGIVTALGGQISFQSEPASGTTFRVLLPRPMAEHEPTGGVQPMARRRRVVLFIGRLLRLVFVALRRLSGRPDFGDRNVWVLQTAAPSYRNHITATRKQMGTRLYVGNLPYAVTELDLRDLFGGARHRDGRQDRHGS